MSENILKIESVTMQFGGVVAVNDLSLEVNRGEIVALIGPNGAGKTTAFNCVTGIYEPTNGLISFEGNPIIRNHPDGKMRKAYTGEKVEVFTKSHMKETLAELDNKIKAAKASGDEEALAALNDEKTTLLKNEKLRDGYAFTSRVLSPTPDSITRLGIARTFQNIRLWKSMTVFENVLTAKHMRANQSFLSATFRTTLKEERRMREETMHLLEEQNLARFKDELATSLPYGLQRRLEIARALATDPTLLLLDEPAAGMNPQETQELGEFIVEIKNKYNLTVFMIEHHMDLVMQFSDRIYVIDFGKLICEGTPAHVQADPRVIEAYLGVAE